MINIKCNNCWRIYNLNDEMAWKKAKCSNCSNIFSIEAKQELQFVAQENNILSNIDLDNKNETNNVINQNILQKNWWQSPFSNEIVWVLSFLFWPMAWGILVYSNFKKLWRKYYAYISLIWSIFLTVVFCYVFFKVPSLSSFKVTFIWPVLFISIQKNFVDKRKKENINKSFWSNWKAFLLGLFWFIIFISIIWFSALLIDWL